MNLLCPHCQKMLTIADQYAGQTMKCPLCSNTFQAPLLPTPLASPVPSTQQPFASPEVIYTPAPNVSTSPPLSGTSGTQPCSPPPGEAVFSFASPPPGPPRIEEIIPGNLAPEPLIQQPASKPPIQQPVRKPPSPPSPPGDYQHSFTIWLSPRVMTWVTPAALCLLFLLFFFPWIQSVISTENSTGWGTAIGSHWSLLGLMHVLFFFLALVAAVSSVFVDRMSIQLPSPVRELWPWRSGFMGGLALLSFLFLVLELLAGFGIERAVGADGKSIPTKFLLPFEMLLRRTVWLDLAVLCQVVAIVAACIEFWLVVRKNRPLPRADLRW